MTVLLLLLTLGQDPAVAAASRSFGCQGPFTADLTEQRLIAIYGAANVRTGEVYVGEGFSEPGAVVFPESPVDRFEVVWNDGKARALPRFVRVRDKNTRWRTADGISVGTDLKTIERINRRPFRLLGFGWDYSGTVSSWSGGRLQGHESSRCSIGARLSPEVFEGLDALTGQVMGDREYSSGHPAMQQLNPRVYELWLSFAPPRDDKAAASRVLGCGRTFTVDLTEQRLIEIYGAANVHSGEVHVGEGFTESGSTVFPDSPADRFEVVWSDGKARAFPRFVRVTEKTTRWRTADGISVGTDLKTIERMNRRPFRLLGFEWDYSGMLTSWSGGRLDQETSGCGIGMRLSPESVDGLHAVLGQVMGEGEFSSGHPAMQQLNPRVYQLWLSFPDRRRRH